MRSSSTAARASLAQSFCSETAANACSALIRERADVIGRGGGYSHDEKRVAVLFTPRKTSEPSAKAPRLSDILLQGALLTSSLVAAMAADLRLLLDATPHLRSCLNSEFRVLL